MRFGMLKVTQWKPKSKSKAQMTARRPQRAEALRLQAMRLGNLQIYSGTYQNSDVWMADASELFSTFDGSELFCCSQPWDQRRRNLDHLSLLFNPLSASRTPGPGHKIETHSHKIENRTRPQTRQTPHQKATSLWMHFCPLRGSPAEGKYENKAVEAMRMVLSRITGKQLPGLIQEANSKICRTTSTNSLAKGLHSSLCIATKCAYERKGCTTCKEFGDSKTTSGPPLLGAGTSLFWRQPHCFGGQPHHFPIPGSACTTEQPLGVLSFKTAIISCSNAVSVIGCCTNAMRGMIGGLT